MVLLCIQVKSSVHFYFSNKGVRLIFGRDFVCEKLLNQGVFTVLAKLSMKILVHVRFSFSLIAGVICAGLNDFLSSLTASAN